MLVTLEGFMEYYRDVGVCEPYDTVFVPTMEVRSGVLIVMHGVVVRPQTLASLQCRDGARRVFIDQAEIACTKRESS